MPKQQREAPPRFPWRSISIILVVTFIINRYVIMNWGKVAPPTMGHGRAFLYDIGNLTISIVTPFADLCFLMIVCGLLIGYSTDKRNYVLNQKRMQEYNEKLKRAAELLKTWPQIPYNVTRNNNRLLFDGVNLEYVLTAQNQYYSEAKSEYFPHLPIYFLAYNNSWHIAPNNLDEFQQLVRVNGARQATRRERTMSAGRLNFALKRFDPKTPRSGMSHSREIDLTPEFYALMNDTTVNWVMDTNFIMDYAEILESFRGRVILNRWVQNELDGLKNNEDVGWRARKASAELTKIQLDGRLSIEFHVDSNIFRKFALSDRKTDDCVIATAIECVTSGKKNVMLATSDVNMALLAREIGKQVGFTVTTKQEVEAKVTL
ncbi:MAG: hypothetical protein K6T81_16355 [Alicyclobacillus macrosporangiidus]|uniref:PIN domain-containing protein n=1 Tax=Alicyclobacillus macrosporangiidus TaxID=392015 RepID=UPI0026ED6CA7|nr:PIN domain-containing protein [Alicyclobacillus macrosporangiidus]MCL6600287.1 hypothetical protein [Alicyclobacillus macrosporangiidus]